MLEQKEEEERKKLEKVEKEKNVRKCPVCEKKVMNNIYLIFKLSLL